MPRARTKPTKQAPAPAPESAPAAAPETVAPAEPVSASSAIRSKYRLDAQCAIDDKGADGKPLGPGLVMDQATFEKFDVIDPTPEKSYLDWMLFQAGGGIRRYELTLAQWGESDKVVSFREVYARFSKESQNSGTSIDKFKGFVMSQNDIKVRDRVHCVFIYVKLNHTESDKRMTEADAEALWAKNLPKRKREYVFGDQDHVRMGLYGFSRNWPGEQNIYEKVTSEVRLFISNRRSAEAWNKNLDGYNAQVTQRNATLPKTQHFPIRELIDIDFNIGRIQMDGHGDLKYTGPYDTVEKLAEANKRMFRLTVRERVLSDVKYLGKLGGVGRSEKVYEDDNVVVVMPLTVAASVRSGSPSWKTAHPDNIEGSVKNPTQTSDWTKHTTGSHGYEGHNNERLTLAYFTFKDSKMVATRKLDLRQIAMHVFSAEMGELTPPYDSVVWLDSAGNKMSYQSIISSMHSAGMDESVVKSFESGAAAVAEVCKDFDPTMIVSDFMKHHEKRAPGIRGIREEEMALEAGRLTSLLIGD